MKNTESRMTDKNTTSDADFNFKNLLGEVQQDSTLTLMEKFENFPKYVSRQYLSYYLAKYEVFKKILNIHGSIVECGVFQGGGLLWWAQLSAILEPYNHQRRVVGFDTFQGFPALDNKDVSGSVSSHHEIGGLDSGAYDEILNVINAFDKNRQISHIEKIKLVKGDVKRTIPDFLEANPHTLVSLLILDMDLYEPSIEALKYFLPRMPKGSIIWFDEINAPQWPGETLAVMEVCGIENLRLQRHSFESHSCYAIIE
jgi:hypothetical protein